MFTCLLTMGADNFLSKEIVRKFAYKLAFKIFKDSVAGMASGYGLDG
jgi:hypothetical protein